MLLLPRKEFLVIFNPIKNKETKSKTINNYLLISDKRKKGFICINISFNRTIINREEYDYNFDYQINTLYQDEKSIRSLKRVIHPLYGECLLCNGEYSDIDLWINNKGF